MQWPIVCFDDDLYAYVLTEAQFTGGYLEEAVLVELVASYDSSYRLVRIRLDGGPPVAVIDSPQSEREGWRRHALLCLAGHGRYIKSTIPLGDALSDEQLWRLLSALP